MWHKTASLVVLLVAIATGCGDDDGGASLPTTTTITLPPLKCPDPIAVSSADELVAALASIPWEGAGGYTSGPLPITPDLVISRTVVLEAADLPVPANCLDRSDCRPQAALRMGTPAPGVTLEGRVDLACGDGFSRLTLTDTTVRLRPMLRDTHPCEYNSVPLVEVAPPCGTPCEEGLALCPVDGVCYAAGIGFCQACEGGTKEACACRGPEGPLADGASCSYWQSGDVLCGGRCQQGVCAAEPCP